MFDFAISQQQRQPPTRRYVTSLATSCLAHVFALQMLIAYPGLLGPGIAHWFRTPASRPDDQLDRRSWRTVAVLNSPTAMRAPSAATLRANTYDWGKAAKAASAPRVYPRIPVRWSEEPKRHAQEPAPAPPPVRPVPGVSEPVRQAAGNVDVGTAGSETAVVYLPPAQTSPVPRQIPQGVEDRATLPSPTSVAPAPPASAPKSVSSRPQQEQAAQVFENRQQAIQSEGSGFFDTKGFPLGEYATVVIERVKSNWLIPSNLRNSRGRTTVVFFIGRDGRYTGAQIIKSSGNTSLDLAALNAVLTSNPFPPLPQGFPGSQVGAKFVFAYNEQQ